MKALPRKILQGTLAALLTVFALVFTAGPAMAHTTLKTSDPADGSSLSAVPTAVTLTFEEAVTLPANPISVTGPEGSTWTVGTPTISGASVSAPVQATGPAGRYTLNYTVTADDGDAVKGAVHFTLATAATPTTEAVAPTTAAAVAAPTPVAQPSAPAPAPAAAADQSSGMPGWVWAVVAVVAVAVVAGLVVARSRRAGSDR